MGRDKSIMGNCVKRNKRKNKAGNDEPGRRGTDRTENRRAMGRGADDMAPCLQRYRLEHVEAMQDVSGGATEGAARALRDRVMAWPWAVIVLEEGRWRARGWKCWRRPIFEHMFIYGSAGSAFFIRRRARFRWRARYGIMAGIDLQ